MIKEFFFTEDRKNNNTKLDIPWPQILSNDPYSHSIDDELLDAAGETIKVLFYGGPTNSLYDEDTTAVISRYLARLDAGTTKLERFLIVHLILYYLIYQVGDDETKPGSSWNDESRAVAIEKAEQILQAPHWPGLIEAGLASQDNRLFCLANRAAYVLGIDTWDKHWARLQKQPLDNYSWQNIMQKATPDNIDAIINFALQVIPWSQMTAGPTGEPRLDSENQIHRSLGTIVHPLRDYPGTGQPLILACLKGPVVDNQNLALNVLAKWGHHHWNPEIEAAMVQARKVEPSDEMREQLEKLLQAEALS
jgi:hypothetical protein